MLGIVYWQTEPDPELLDEALGATQRALQLDNHNAVFHMLRGRVQLARREYGSALVENQLAVELKRPEQLELYLEGLRLAGLPEG